ncbi:MAG: MotA/TolQ/ExbB proton channel family protein [Oscillospiraceae bacterium]|nr:MotA/TolQ/ExbB proton channel family protein [Oscillospiraceae bacterium]
MELTTALGMVMGFAFIIICILWPGSVDIMAYVDPASVFIVVGGVIASTVVAYPLNTLKNLVKVMSKAFKARKLDLPKDIDMIIDVANVARRESILAIEDSVKAMNDPFFLKGAMLVMDGIDPELVREVMEMELSYIESRHSGSQSVILQMSSFSPAYGMIGTLVGLINMLGSLTDMDALGPNMAIALVTTFYGVILANLIFTPIAKKLKMMGDDEILRSELLLEGILAIQAGENPTLIRERLNAFLPQSQLEKLKSK